MGLVSFCAHESGASARSETSHPLGRLVLSLRNALMKLLANHATAAAVPPTARPSAGDERRRGRRFVAGGVLLVVRTATSGKARERIANVPNG